MKWPKNLEKLPPFILEFCAIADFDNQNTIRHSFDLKILCSPIMLILPFSDTFQRTPSTLWTRKEWPSVTQNTLAILEGRTIHHLLAGPCPLLLLRMWSGLVLSTRPTLTFTWRSMILSPPLPHLQGQALPRQEDTEADTDRYLKFSILPQFDH